MPNHSGPNINEQGLVFYFDTGNSLSYKGAPGVNIAAGPNFGYSSGGLSEFENGKLIRWKSYSEKTYISTLGIQEVKTIEWYNVYSAYGVDGNYNCCPTIFTYSPSGWNSTILEPSTEYMYQIIYKSASGYTHPNYMYHYERSVDDSQGTEFGVHSNGRRTYLGDGWYHAWGPFTTQNYTVKGYFGSWHYEYNTKNKVSVAAVSLVKGNIIRKPEDFISEGLTLSSTESLKDLTGNSTIDLSNVSFDSNAQMTFDGTDDYIEAPDSNALDVTSEVSFEFVVNADATQSNPYPRLLDKSSYLVHLSQTAPFSIAQNINTSDGLRQVSVGSAFPADTLSHIITTYNGTVGKIYVNGSLVTTNSWDTFLPCTVNGSTLKIGGDGGTGRPLNGELPLVKIYNRALTAEEIKANFNAIKGRFNI